MIDMRTKFVAPPMDEEDGYCHLATEPGGETLCGSPRRRHRGHSTGKGYRNPPAICPQCERTTCPDCLARLRAMRGEA